MTEAELTDRLYEEYLADEFEVFKQKQKVKPELKSLFERIIEWITSVFNRFTKNLLRVLSTNLEKCFSYISVSKEKDRFLSVF